MDKLDPSFWGVGFRSEMSRGAKIDLNFKGQNGGSGYQSKNTDDLQNVKIIMDSQQAK